MQSSHLNAFSYFERFPVFGSLGDGQAISAPNDGQLAELLELYTQRRVSTLAEYIQNLSCLPLTSNETHNPRIATGMVRVTGESLVYLKVRIIKGEGFGLLTDAYL